MSTKSNNSMASKALLELDSIKKTIKEESKNTLKSLLTEAVKDYVREAAEKDDEEEDVEIIEDEKDCAEEKDCKKESDKKVKDGEASEDDEEQEQPEVAEPNKGEAESASDAQEAPQGEGEDDGWAEFSQYQVGDDANNYDLTGEKDYDQVVKVFKLMKGDDVIKVVNDGDKVKIQDNETGAEYIIDVDNEGETVTEGKLNEDEFHDVFDDEDEVSEEDFDDLIDEPADEEEAEFEIADDDEDEDEIDDLESEEDAPVDDENIAGLPADNFNEGKKAKKAMKENKENIFEVELHDYTDEYQDVDAIEGLSNEEPSKSGKSWEKGVPTGTEKPWAGESKSKGKPFAGEVKEEAEDELDEAAMSCSSQADAKATKSNKSTPRFANKRQVSKVMSVAGEKKELGESYKAVAEALMEENKQLRKALDSKKAENKELKESLMAVRTGLHEQRVTNVNLAKITKLFCENAVSQKEKEEIINRFSNEAKTIAQAKALYESIDKELKKAPKVSAKLNESSMSVKGTEVVNESKAYKSKDLLETLDFIKRLESC